MRLLHTADWHLGRNLGGHALLEEQEHLLRGQFLDVVKEERPAAVLIAGDVFDRAMPPADAVGLLDDILDTVVLRLNVPVVMIPGNHDEARRMSFGAGLLRRAGLHIADSPLGRAVTLVDPAGNRVSIVGAGYATPLALAHSAGGETFADHDAGCAWLMPRLLGLCEDGARRVLVAHAFVTGGADSESERGLAVGGSGQVAASRFDGFDYVALGHLHRPQTLSGGRLRYAGSPLAYSVSEADHRKSVTLLDIDSDGGIIIEEVELNPRRALRVLSGNFDALLTRTEDREDFVAIELTDPAPVPEAQRRLSGVFPRIVGLSYVALAQQAVGAAAPLDATRNTAPLDLFDAFFRTQRGAGLPDPAREVAVAAISAAEMDLA